MGKDFICTKCKEKKNTKDGGKKFMGNRYCRKCWKKLKKGFEG